MRMEGGGASKGMRGEEKEEGEDPKASADPAGNQGREGESKQREGKGWEGKGWLVTAFVLVVTCVCVCFCPAGLAGREKANNARGSGGRERGERRGTKEEPRTGPRGCARNQSSGLREKPKLWVPTCAQTVTWLLTVTRCLTVTWRLTVTCQTSCCHGRG